eukprot:CAMPEP_0201285592 /NCGR_PEP_ID=MMETSP1317-20130820/113556_1 /ASSEMBLY_ACC=CAM_ASM_000770 /TAXON_ID=187299 /ORGANISM="Undescribed Undescribed, Strain Undescribed" /LENGTH=396 /DNA_ID=CAMNT_0047611203 /DNA_START=7811 /DNA_END=9000 /DNA_ORIENTATION=+
MMKKTVQTSVPLAAKCNTWVMGCATLNATLKHVSTMGTTAWNVTSSALKIIVKFAFLTKLQMGAAKKSVTQRLVLTTEATVLSFVPWGVLSPTLATPIVTWSASTQLVIGMGRTAMIWAVPLTVITLISTMASVKSFVTTLGVTTMETTAMKESVPRGVRPAWWMTALAMQSATRQLATGTATTVSSSPLVRRNVWKSSLVTEFVTPECNVESCDFDGLDCKDPEEECSAGCKVGMVNDGTCQTACQVETCAYDGFDCEEPYYCHGECDVRMINDGKCDMECLTESCNLDGTDCDPCQKMGCPVGWDGDGVCNPECNVEECDWDRGDCGDCDGCSSDMIDDGLCQESCYTEECNYDGSDCSHISGWGCPTEWIGDGECDPECYNFQCLFDDEDCEG